MSTLNMVLKKALQGKLASRDSLTSAQEKYPSKSLLHYAVNPDLDTRPFRRARLVSSAPYDYAFRSIGATETLTIPRRFRRWTSDVLIYGAELFSEGTDGDIITASQVELVNDVQVQANFQASADFSVASETFLALQSNSIANAVAESNLKVWPLNNVNTTQFSVFTSVGLLGAGDGGSSYSWSHYGYSPPKLLPVPDDENTCTTYLAILPDKWPVYDRTLGAQRSDVFGRFLTKNTVSNVNVTATFSGERLLMEMDAASVLVDDFIVYLNQIFCVSETVSIGGGRENVFLTPLPGFDPTSIPSTPSTSVETLYTVGELTSNPDQSPGSDADGNRIPALYNSPCLDWIRVRNLYPPTLSESHRALNSMYVAGTTMEQIGLAPVLIPARTGLVPGQPSEGVSDLENVILDPSVQTDQEIIVDYEEGAFHLSHPIVEASQLNPDSVFDAQGFPVLFGLFAEWNGVKSPQQALELKSGPDGDLIEPIPDPFVANSPVSRASSRGWKVDVGSGNLSEYHPSPSQDLSDTPKVQYGGKREAFYFTTGSGWHQGPAMVFEQRSNDSGLVQVGAVGFGGRNSAVNEFGSQITLIPEVGDGQSLSSTAKPDIRFTTYKALFGVFASLTHTVTSGDVLAGNLNGTDFSITLIGDGDEIVGELNPPTGVQNADGVRTLPEIIEDIVEKLDAQFDRDQDYFLSYYHDGTDYVLVFEGVSSLEITTDDASLFSTSVGASRDLEIGFGYNRILRQKLKFVERTNQLWWDGEGILVKGVKLGHVPDYSYVVDGFEIGQTVGNTTETVISLLPGKAVTRGLSREIQNETQFVLNDATTYAFYLNSATGAIESLMVPTTLDTAFFAVPSKYDVPLLVVHTDSADVSGLALSYDCRDLGSQGGTAPITIGSDGVCRTLPGAFELARFYASRHKVAPSVELTEDLTLDMATSRFSVYGTAFTTPYAGSPLPLPREGRFIGHGHKITIANIPNQTGLGDPVFVPSREGTVFEISNIVFQLEASTSVPSSVLGTNVANDGTITLKKITTEIQGSFVTNLVTHDPVNSDVGQGLYLEDCNIEGSLRTGPTQNLSVKQVKLTGTSLVQVGIEGRGSFEQVSTDGIFQVSQWTQSHVLMDQLIASQLILVSTNSGNQFMRASIRNASLTTALQLGNGTEDYDGHIVTQGVVVRGNSTTTPVTIQDASTVELYGTHLISAADVSVLIDDSNVKIQGFDILTSSGTTGIAKNAFRIQGDAGTTVNGTPEMQSNVEIWDGTIRLNDGYAIYIVKRNSLGREVVIQNVYFKADGGTNLNSRGVVLGKSLTTATDGLQARNVKIHNNVFDSYFRETGGAEDNESVAVSSSQLSTTTFEGVYVSGNTVKGNSGSLATGFYDVNIEGGRAAADINFFMDN